ncbi:hypothetical protein WFZ85_14955 [Flavobacterium sp. j3]|uniref:Lipoprotein n=1 Tax=Flavobacterium aureirubrum TaxID=3133147 RepID=A0ABU9N8I0_9FLAO
MNRKILSFLILFSIISCDNAKLNSLENRIVELETENKSLEKKIAQANFNKISASQINLFPDNVFVRVGEKMKVRGKFFEQNSLPKFNIYETDSIYSKTSRKILLENVTDSSFEIFFEPRNKTQNKMYISAEFDFNGEKFETKSLVQFVIK